MVEEKDELIQSQKEQITKADNILQRLEETELRS